MLNRYIKGIASAGSIAGLIVVIVQIITYGKVTFTWVLIVWLLFLAVLGFILIWEKISDNAQQNQQ